jgi:hypothetical protein
MQTIYANIIKASKEWHSPDFVADEHAFIFGTALLSEAAMDTLTGYDK